MSAFIVMWHDLPRLPCAHNYRASQLICCEWYLDVLKILLSAQDSWARPRVSQAPRWSSHDHQDSLLTLLFYTMLLCCTLSHVRLFATPWTVAHQVRLSIGFFKQEYWSGLPCPPPGGLPDPKMEHASLMSSALAGASFTATATIYTQPNKLWTWTPSIRKFQNWSKT